MSGIDVAKLQKQISKLEAELKESKKYGLVWDKEHTPEKVVNDCQRFIPYLDFMKSKSVLNNGRDNILIEGDNYHALTCLNMLNSGKNGFIDVVYIDPPYNTGAKDWKYNNDYVDSEDGYRHSKWIRMMERRLKLCRNIMKQSGIIVCAIDHYELFQLGMLMNEIFGEENRIGIVSVVHKPEGRNQEKFFATSNEFALFYAKNIKNCNFQSVVLSTEKEDEFCMQDEKGKFRLEPLIAKNHGRQGEDKNLRINRPHKFYPIYVSKDCSVISLEEKDGYIPIYPITKQERTWKYVKDQCELKIKEKEIIAIKKGGQIQLFEKYRITKGELIKTHWIRKEYNANMFGTRIIKDVLGDCKFDFPKSLYLMKDILKVTSDKNATILDFFAGSGTTGQAMLELNKEDGGNRRFILCTNNENNICSDITYPRLKTVITGKRNNGTKYSDGLAGNLRYFKTEFIANSKNRSQNKYNLVEKIDPLLCILEDTYNEVEKTDFSSHYSNEEHNKHLFIYNDFYNEIKFNQFKQKVEKEKGKKYVYIFNEDNIVESDLFKGEDIVVKPIPAKIYEIYVEIVKDIKRG